MGMVQQRRAIKKILDEMFFILPWLCPENRASAREYLSEIWIIVMSLVTSFEGRHQYSVFLQEKFGGYIAKEEERIKRNLEQVKYRIDDVETLYMIAGFGRLEKVVTNCHMRRSVDSLS